MLSLENLTVCLSRKVEKCREMSSFENFWWSVEKSREMSRNVGFWKFMMVYLMELVGDVLGWVELEVFWAGWRCLEVFWAGLRCCGLFPIDDFDIIRRYATRREMLRNVEKMSRNVKMSSFVQVANYWGGPTLFVFSRIFAQKLNLREILAKISGWSHSNQISHVYS